jgi:hypothetical protein
MILHNGEPPLRAKSISKPPSQKKKKRERPLPPKREMARNAFSAAGQAVRSGFARVSDEEKARRLAICNDCEFFRHSDQRCSKCGCALKWKSRLEAWHCPIEKW